MIISIDLGTSGLVLYAVVRDQTPAFWKPATSTWVTYTTTRTDFAYALTEIGTTGVYWAALPGRNDKYGKRAWTIYQCVAGSPVTSNAATSDPALYEDYERVGGTIAPRVIVTDATNPGEMQFSTSLISNSLEGCRLLIHDASSNATMWAKNLGMSVSAGTAILYYNVEGTPAFTLAVGDWVDFYPPSFGADDRVYVERIPVSPASVNSDMNIVSSARATLISEIVANASIAALISNADAAKTAAQASFYHAIIGFYKDDTNDEYTIQWMKNDTRLTSGVTVPTLQVIKRSDGGNLIASMTPTTISNGLYKHDATTTARLAVGDSAIVVVTATIDAATRTWVKVIGRDDA